LEARTDITAEERDLIMQLSPLYLEQIQAAKLEGEQHGEQRGKTIGEEQKQQEIAVKMLQKNIPLETIAAITELSIEQLQFLRSQLQDS
jgi:predicted transposase/invertase (TIGR01784 family)